MTYVLEHHYFDKKPQLLLSESVSELRRKNWNTLLVTKEMSLWSLTSEICQGQTQKEERIAQMLKF